MKSLKRLARDAQVAYQTTEGSRHTKVTVGDNVTFVPRHKEIGEILAEEIMKQAKGGEDK